MPEKTRDPGHLGATQYASPERLRARWSLLERYTQPPVSPQRDAVDRLKLCGDESILDVGCGEGTVLGWLRAERGHRGRLYGLDLSPRMFAEVRAAHWGGAPCPIDFQVGSADALPFASGSLDAVLSFFMLYHVPDVDRALGECVRVLRAGGQLAVATMSDQSFPRLKGLSASVGVHLGSSSCPRVSASFTFENGEPRLERHFRVCDRIVYEGVLQTCDVDAVVACVASWRDLYEPAPADGDWARALAAVRKEIESIVLRDGAFCDRVRRGAFVCEKAPAPAGG